MRKTPYLHLEALWRTARWLTLSNNSADELVLKTITRAYRSWHGYVDTTIGSKARLFKILSREFSGSGDRSHQRGLTLSERCEAAINTLDGGQNYQDTSIESRELLRLTRISDVSIKDVIVRFKPESRLIMILLFRERFSYAEIAYITGLRKDAVRSILGRLRRLIPRYLVQYPDGFETPEDNRTTFKTSLDKEKKLYPRELLSPATDEATADVAAVNWENEGGVFDK